MVFYLLQLHIPNTSTMIKLPYFSLHYHSRYSNSKNNQSINFSKDSKLIHTSIMYVSILSKYLHVSVYILLIGSIRKFASVTRIFQVCQFQNHSTITISTLYKRVILNLELRFKVDTHSNHMFLFTLSK